MSSLLRYIKGALEALTGRNAGERDSTRKEGVVFAFRLLQDARVQAELGLDANQLGRLRKIVRDCQQKRQAEIGALRARGEAAFRQLVPAVRARVAADVMTAADKTRLLTPTQEDRFRQLIWQNRGLGAFGDPAVQEALALSPEQRQGIRTILHDALGLAQRVRQEVPEGDEAIAGGRVAAIRREAMAKGVAILTDAQRHKWRELVGAPFDLRDHDDPGGPETEGRGRGRPRGACGMNDEEKEDTTVYRVVVNHEEQYSLWPVDAELPAGWQNAGKSGSRAECLAYVEQVWTDMRPLSLRRASTD